MQGGLKSTPRRLEEFFKAICPIPAPSPAVLPNGDQTGTIVIFNAIDMTGIEAASQSFLNGPLASTLEGTPAKGIAAARDGTTEILLRVKSIGGSASKSEVVSVRQGRRP
jgi:hypothetical protein